MLKLLVLLSAVLVLCSAQGCTNCQVDGRTYRGGSNFQFDRGCYRFSCKCNCDGSWNCPSSLTTNKCIGGGNQNAGACGNCQVNGGSYRGGSDFQFDRGCNRFSCRCNCDGSWNCPSNLTTSICSGSRNGACRNCKAYGRTYGRGSFQMDQGCYRYSCTCNCDGSWNCPAGKTKSIC